MAQQATSRVRFGAFELRRDERRLLAGGQPLPVGARAFDLLEVLVDHRDRVMAKHELLDLVWPGQDVEEANLNVQVSNLRKLLGGDAIATVPGRGYRFVCPLLADDEPSPSPAHVAVQPAPAPRPVQQPSPAPGPRLLPLSTLPILPGAVIGRDRERDELQRLVDAHRLVTVLGPGGIGKTTLALAVAGEHESRCPAGVLWVELAQVTSPDLLPSVLAGALGIPPADAAATLKGVTAALRTTDLLIVLDNAEHLVGAVAALAQAILVGTDRVRLLVTSQSALRLTCEQVYRLEPLAVPQEPPTAEQALDYGAVALFVDRVRNFDRHFAVTPATVASVVNICRQLDGVALALELAAARVPLLGLKGLQQRLGERFLLLTQGHSTAPVRQHTLRAALDWSYGLLSAQEQWLFRHLGVFVGGFTLDLALGLVRELRSDPAAVSPWQPGQEDWQVIDCLEALVHRSLVSVVPRVAAEAEEPPRYRLLESARDYGLMRLQADGELARARAAHAATVLQLMRSARHALWVTPQQTWLRQHEPELDNLRSALDWAATHQPAAAVALLGAAMPLFECLSLVQESRRRSDPLAAALDGLSLPTADRARFLLARSEQARSESKTQQHDMAMAAAALFRECSDMQGLYEALYSVCACFHGYPDDAMQAADEMMRIEQPHWPPALRGLGRIAVSKAHYGVGDMVANRAALEAALPLVQGAGADRLTDIVLTNLADHDLYMGRVDEAIERGFALCELLRQGRQRWSLVFSQGNLAGALMHAQRVPEARQQLEEALPMMRSLEWSWFAIFGDVYALLAAEEGRHEDAARLAGWADRMASERGAREPNEARCRERAQQLSESALGPARFAQLLAEGAGLSEEQVVSATLRDPRCSG